VEIDQVYEVVDISGDSDPLKEHPQNPNKGAVEIIDESIEENGWFGAVIAQRSTGYILAGNHRYRVARERGATSIPVIWKDIDDETALRILLVDNSSTRAGMIDEEQLHTILSSLTSLDGTGYGSAMHKLEERLAKETEAERGKEEAKDLPPNEQPGDPTPDGIPDPGSADPGIGEVPADKYTPDYGIMVVCFDEGDQEATYEALREFFVERETLTSPRQLRVVAV
jgi:hypothetical protein